MEKIRNLARQIAEHVRHYQEASASWEEDIRVRLEVFVLNIAKAHCPWCAGSAVKAGVYNVKQIQPVSKSTRTLHFPSSNLTVEEITWLHHVEVEHETYLVFEQQCWAEKIWIALSGEGSVQS